jgi:hypothetical protein
MADENGNAPGGYSQQVQILLFRCSDLLQGRERAHVSLQPRWGGGLSVTADYRTQTTVCKHFQWLVADATPKQEQQQQGCLCCRLCSCCDEGQIAIWQLEVYHEALPCSRFDSPEQWTRQGRL